MARGSVFLALQKNLWLKGLLVSWRCWPGAEGEACDWWAAWEHQAVRRRLLLTGKMWIHSLSMAPEHAWNDVRWCVQSNISSLGDVLVFTAICRKRYQILRQSGELDPDWAHVSSSLAADIKGIIYTLSANTIGLFNILCISPSNCWRMSPRRRSQKKPRFRQKRAPSWSFSWKMKRNALRRWREIHHTADQVVSFLS